MSKMTLPDDEFWDAVNSATFHQGDAETTEKILFDMASVWRSEQNYFAAGYAMEYASRAAQGNQEKMLSHFEAAAQDFENCANSQSPDSYSSMAGLLKLSSLLGQGRWTFGLRTQVLCENILEELGQRLISYYHDSSNKVGFLVTGVRLETDLATSWEAKITQYEVRLGEERWGNGILSVNLPSAFQIFVMLGDYQGAQAVVDECPGGFTTHGLRGWKAAVQAFTTPDEAAEKFAEAAEYFAQDTRPDDPDELRARGSWSSANIELWAK